LIISTIAEEKYDLINVCEWGREGCIKNCTPQIPSAAGFAPGDMFQGGNCLGRVRTEGHLPARARSMVSDDALRRVLSWSGLRSDGMRTKPSVLSLSRKECLVILLESLLVQILVWILIYYLKPHMYLTIFCGLMSLYYSSNTYKLLLRLFMIMSGLINRSGEVDCYMQRSQGYSVWGN